MYRFERKARPISDARKLVELLAAAANQAVARSENNDHIGHIHDMMHRLNDALFAVTVPQERENLRRALDSRAGIAVQTPPENITPAMEELKRLISAARATLVHSGFKSANNVTDFLPRRAVARKKDEASRAVLVLEDPVFSGPC